MTDKDKITSCAIGLDPIKMGQMIEKVNNMHEAICGDAGVLAQLEKQNGRIRKLEVKHAYILGVAVGVSTIIGFVIKIFF